LWLPARTSYPLDIHYIKLESGLPKSASIFGLFLAEANFKETDSAE